MKRLATCLAFLILAMTGIIQAQPLSLEQSVELALQNSPQIKAGQEAVGMAEARVTEARAGMLPKVNATGTYLYFGKIPTTVLDFGGMPFPGADPAAAGDGGGGEPLEIEMGATHNWTGEFSVQQPVFTFGKIWNAYKQSLASLEASKAEFSAVQQQMRLQVTEAFYGVLLTQEYLKVAEQAVELVEAQVKVAQQLRDAGVATDFEVLRAQVQLSSVQSQLVRSENALDLARNGFKMVLGLDMGSSVEVEGELQYREEDHDLDALIKEALEQRPDLTQLAWQAQAGQKLVSIAKAGYLPNFSVAGNYSINDTDQQDRNTSWNIAVVASIPIFNGFATKSQVDQAKSGLRQIALAQEQLADAVEFEVRTSYLQLRETKALVDVQRQSVDQAQESLRLAQLRYENGMLTSVELIDSQLALTQAQVNRLQALHDYVVGLARLRKAIGES